MANSEEFNMELFTKEEHYEETPLLDRKQTIKLWEHEAVIEFVKDIIAFANSARALGKPAYLLLGIENDDPHRLCGISEMWQHYRKIYLTKTGRKRINNECNVWEEISRAIKDIITYYITPSLTVELIHSHYKKNGVRLAYIKIPYSAGEPFKIDRIKKGDERYGIYAGKSYVRFGESKLEVRTLDIELLPYWPYKDDECPFMFPSDWKNYLENFRAYINKYSRVDSNQYVETKLLNYQNVHEFIEDFLDSNNQNRLCVITGQAGSGKTTLMAKALLEVIDNASKNIEAAVQNQEFYLPEGIWLPFFFPLLGLNTDGARSLTNTLSRAISTRTTKTNRMDFSHSSSIEAILLNRRINWIIILDGFDELSTEKGRKSLFSSLSEIINQQKNIKFIITTRPICSKWNWARLEGSEILMPTIKEEQIEQLLRRQVTGVDLSTNRLEHLINFIQSHSDLKQLLANPLYLTGAIPLLIDSIKKQAPILPPQEPQEDPNTREPISEEAPNAIFTPDLTDPELENMPRGITNLLPKEPLQKETLQIPNQDVLKDTEDAVVSADSSQIIRDIEEQTQEQINDNESVIIPPIGKILHYIYSDIGRREIYRHGDEDISFWWSEIGPFAIKINGLHPRFQRRDLPSTYKKDSYKAFHWILSIGIFRELDQEIGWLSFQTELTKQYFAAHHILTRRRSNFFEIEKDYKNMTDDFRMQVDHLIQDIETCIVSE